jgi:hypothetical protein
MQQMRINRMGNGMFHAPQTGPSMAPAFMFANRAQEQEEPKPRMAQAPPPSPTPAAPAPAPAAAPAVAPAATAITWKDWAGPAAVVVLIGALVAWNVR